MKKIFQKNYFVLVKRNMETNYNEVLNYNII